MNIFYSREILLYIAWACLRNVRILVAQIGLSLTCSETSEDPVSHDLKGEGWWNQVECSLSNGFVTQ